MISGTNADDTLNGTSGDDAITALGGNDVVFAGSGNDAVDGGDGVDFLRGEDGSDTLQAGAGDDFLNGGAGDDLLDGGAGIDRVSYANAPGGVTIDLTLQGSVQNTGFGNDKGRSRASDWSRLTWRQVGIKVRNPVLRAEARLFRNCMSVFQTSSFRGSVVAPSVRGAA